MEDPSRSLWSGDEHVSTCWRHRDFPDHIVWAPAPGQLLFAHTSMTSSAPKRSTVIALAHAALGPGALPTDEVMLPLSLRVPLKGPGRLPAPTDPTRCQRMWPTLDEPRHLKDVDGLEVELRVAGTLGPTGLSTYAEALIGWSPVTAPDEEGKQKPRKMFFTGDARHVVVPRSETQVKELTARVMDRLLGFAYWRQDVGLMVDRHGHLPGRLVGRVRVSARETDVEFAVRLPQPSGKAMKFVGDYAVVTSPSPAHRVVAFRGGRATPEPRQPELARVRPPRSDRGRRR